MERGAVNADVGTVNKVWLRARATLLVALFVTLSGIVTITIWARRPAVTVGPAQRSVESVAAMDVQAALHVTPEYKILTRCSRGSSEHHILYRKARLRVAAAAQHVGRKQTYRAVLCAPSSALPDVTERVVSTIVSPGLDFFPVAELSDRPFTGDAIHVGV